LFPHVEVRYLRSVVVLAEELNFTRAAARLHITQSALSKQITEIEEQLGFALFIRYNKRAVQLTDAGTTFVVEARASLLHAERAVRLGRAVHEGSDGVLTVGHSPFADKVWISSLFSIELPLFPQLRIRLKSQFSMELVNGILAGDLDLALVTAPPTDSRIISATFASGPLYAAFSDGHEAIKRDSIGLRDLDRESWILFAKCIHPVAYEVVMELAHRERIRPSEIHETIDPQQAFHLVSAGAGVAILTEPTALSCRVGGVVVKPLTDELLHFETCIVMRSDDRSRMTNEFARTFLRRHPRSRPTQMKLPISLADSPSPSDDKRKAG
jgi:DNA-binding transcriptional LysR family regulator